MLLLISSPLISNRQSIIVGAIDESEAVPLTKFRGQRRSSSNLAQLPDETEQAKTELVHQLRMELHLKDADNKFLQSELDKANEQIAAKDNMLNMLTEGLKEVRALLLLVVIPPSLRWRSTKPIFSKQMILSAVSWISSIEPMKRLFLKMKF